MQQHMCDKTLARNGIEYCERCAQGNNGEEYYEVESYKEIVREALKLLLIYAELEDRQRKMFENFLESGKFTVSMGGRFIDLAEEIYKQMMKNGIGEIKFPLEYEMGFPFD